MKTKIILQTALCAAVLGLAAAANAQDVIPNPEGGIFHNTPEPISQAGAIPLTVPGTLGSGLYTDVTVKFLGGSAGDTDILQYYSGTEANGNTLPSGRDLLNNQTGTPGVTTYDLGDFAAGTEVVFDLAVNGESATWYSGKSIANSDHDDHFDVAPAGSTVTIGTGPGALVYTAPAVGSSSGVIVGVEDATDFDYNDIVYSFSGIVQTVPSVPDVAGTMSLLGLGLTGLMAVGRRFRK